MSHDANASKAAIEDAAPNAALFAKVVNPLLRVAFATPLRRVIAKKVVLIEFSGRRSGKSYRFPVGVLAVRGERVITSRHSWRHNFQGGAPCAVRGTGGWSQHTATLVDDMDDTAAMWGELVERVGLGKTKRQLGLAINVDRLPTHDELTDAVRRIGLGIITFEPQLQ